MNSVVAVAGTLAAVAAVVATVQPSEPAVGMPMPQGDNLPLLLAARRWRATVARGTALPVSAPTWSTLVAVNDRIGQELEKMKAAVGTEAAHTVNYRALRMICARLEQGALACDAESRALRGVHLASANRPLDERASEAHLLLAEAAALYRKNIPALNAETERVAMHIKASAMAWTTEHHARNIEALAAL